MIRLKKLKDYKFMPIFSTTPVSDTQISPNGEKIVFNYSEVNLKENKYDTHLWMTDPKGNTTQFTYGKSNESNPRWSKKGDKIIFVSNRKGEKDTAEEKPTPQLFIIPTSGGEARKLTYIKEGATDPKWSPNERLILFKSKIFMGEKNEDSDFRRITRMVYRFDGKGWYDGKYEHIFTVSSKAGRVKKLTGGEFDVGSMTWSPEGNKVAFVANIEEDADLSRYRNIYTVSSKGEEPEILYKGDGPISSISWSPDGKYIAYTGRVIEDPNLFWHRNTELYIYDTENGTMQCLTSDYDRTIGTRTSPVWSPDSKTIYFKAPNHGSVHIYKTNLEGKVEQVTKGKFNIGSFSLDASGEILVYSLSNVLTPSEAYLHGETPKRLTHMTKDIMKKINITEPEEFWFKANDGVKVQGWIIKPHQYKKGEKYPTTLEVHGGPRGAYSFNFGAAEHEFQVLAEHGYVVVYTNPRGSTGFGEEFSRVISGYWGDKDYMDCMVALDYVIENYDYVDSNRLGILGGSYGGWMTNWAVGHTNRFKAAVTMRSISNWYSMHGTSDIAFNEHDIGWGKEPWEDPELILSKSPITYIENINTPLLIIHSENDFRCPIEQGEQLYVGLKKLGRTTEFIRFPDEFHGLSRTGQPKHRIERLQHILRWFDTHLK
ncbi:MAG: S9 family peptidase [Candidatus Kariarchaeaceae archaeon]|jgi:acylaminoacyl-peptidase